MQKHQLFRKKTPEICIFLTLSIFFVERGDGDELFLRSG